MKETGRLILEKIQEIQEKRREQDVLLRKMHAQAQLMCQGIDPQDVKHLWHYRNAVAYNATPETQWVENPSQKVVDINNWSY